jgi:hypothetical protein
MYRLFTVMALMLVTGCTTQDSTRPKTARNPPRIIRQIDFPLRLGGEAPQAKDGAKSFRSGATRGWIKHSGGWNLTTEVSHSRLRCATYESGIRIGHGDASCTTVKWLTDTAFATMRLQCNAATVIHTGGGRIKLPRSALESANCVQVVVRCTGGC